MELVFLLVFVLFSMGNADIDITESTELKTPPPDVYQIDKATGLKYIWFEDGNGTDDKAFVEGGPPHHTKVTDRDIQFYLFTKNNPSSPQELKPYCDHCLHNSYFIPWAPVKIICHGFTRDYLSDLNIYVKNAYFSLPEAVNVISVNWKYLALFPWYDTATKNAPVVGYHTALLVDYLVAQGVTSYSNVHFIGHSLGAHVGGFAGSRTLQKIGRITALDPALVLYEKVGDDSRIDNSDAEFVDVIHTAGGLISFAIPRGTVDFYPNGGTPNQPGCTDPAGSCSHARSYFYMAESIMHPTSFRAYSCSSWRDYLDSRCFYNHVQFMGDGVALSARGNFFLATRATPLFGIS